MDIKVYLPDELGEEAKARGLNFSAMLREAVSQELERLKTMFQLAEGASEHLLDVEDREGRVYQLRLHGTCITDDDDVGVYVTDDERVVWHSESRMEYGILTDPENELQELGLDQDDYIGAMHALGFKPVVDL